LAIAGAKNIPVSIVIPAFNAERYVGAAVKSVLAQTYAPLEVIVIDDGSTDGTFAALQELAPAIRLIRQSNAGQAAALNRGWDMSSGELLGYLSADDLLLPGAIERTAAALAHDPAAVLAYPNFGLIDENAKATGVVHAQDYSERALYRELVCLPGPGALFRRTAFARVGGWNPALRQIPDLDFFLRLALQGPFVHVPEVLAEFRMHGDSATYRPVSRERAEEPIQMVREFFARTDIPPRQRAWQPYTTANAYLLSGMIHGQSGRLGSAMRRFAQAFVTSPRTTLSMKTAGYALRIARIAVKGG
jgi:glycosyltransferase involved in cell wall biosynthesis